MLQKSDHLQVMVAYLLRLSDSSRLSDKQCSKRIALVRFFETATFIYLCTC